MKKISVFLVLAILLVSIALIGKYFLATRSSDVVGTNQKPLAVCTLEARVCPDGSAVGRSGPACEFKACPEVTVENETSTSTATSTVLVNNNSKLLTDSTFSDVVINKTYTKNSISITPLEVIEDSRCPAGVMCIQAGTVRLRVKLKAGSLETEQILTLAKSVLFTGKQVTLSSVEPAARVDVSSEDRKYVFNFQVENQSATTSAGF